MSHGRLEETLGPMFLEVERNQPPTLEDDDNPF
jgi:hypothetical protein